MEDHQRGVTEFGLNLEGLVREAWRIFLSRPLTLLGVSCLVQICWLPTHLFGVTSFFWLPFTLCVPYATVLILRGEKSDRIYLGWINWYPRLLAIFSGVAVIFTILLVLCGAWVAPVSHTMDVYQTILPEIAKKSAEGVSFTVDGSRAGLPFLASGGWLLLPLLLESILTFMVGLVGMVSIRKKVSAPEAFFEVFNSWRHILEVVLFGMMLGIFALSGLVVCCVGILVTTTFAWICLGVGYYQMYEQ
jgi:hypothetical protein